MTPQKKDPEHRRHTWLLRRPQQLPISPNERKSRLCRPLFQVNQARRAAQGFPHARARSPHFNTISVVFTARFTREQEGRHFVKLTPRKDSPTEPQGFPFTLPLRPRGEARGGTRRKEPEGRAEGSERGIEVADERRQVGHGERGRPAAGG